MNQKRVAFIYGMKYSGHYRAAESIQTVLSRYYPDKYQVINLELDTHIYGTWGNYTNKLYWTIARYVPWLLDFLWDNKAIELLTRLPRQMVFKLFSRKLIFKLNQIQPDMVVCTHALACNLLNARTEWYNNKRIPLIAVITDYGIHPYWLCKRVDLYIVPTDEIRTRLIRWGVEKDKVQVGGIPIHPEFTSKSDKDKVRFKLGLSPCLPTVLLMGGSRGFLPINSIVSRLFQLPFKLQVLVVTGTNTGLYNQLNQLATKIPELYLVNYHNGNVAELMDAADLLVTKPGGLTISEAMAKKLPLLIYQVIQAQERANTRYLIKNQAAIRVHNIDEIITYVGRLLSNGNGEISRLSDRIGSLGFVNSAELAVNWINTKFDAVQ